MVISRALQRHSLIYLIGWLFQRVLGVSTSRIRLLPDFLIIGVQRCGTTSLFNYMAQHRDFHPSNSKETQFFSNKFYKGVNWYRSHFPFEWQKKYQERNPNRSFVSGEATPYYIFHPLAAKRIFKTIPDVRLIVMLRNPIDRAYSHYQYEVKMGFETLSFEDAIAQESDRLAGQVEMMVKNGKYLSFNHQHFSYLSRGKYYSQLSSWLEMFSMNQMLILISEEMFENPKITLDKFTRFMNMKDLSLPSYKKYNYTEYGEIDPSTRQWLGEYFKPENEKLCDLLNQNINWY